MTVVPVLDRSEREVGMQIGGADARRFAASSLENWVDLIGHGGAPGMASGVQPRCWHRR
jgi:hypothetical protein